MKLALVVNIASGGLIGREALACDFAAKLAAAGHVILGEPAAGPLPARLDAALALAPDAVVVAGGDGTIACAAQALAGTPIALGIIPLGTMNLLAKDLGLPLDLDGAIAALASATPRAIDVAEVNGHVYLCASVLGLPSLLGRHRERQRGRAGLRGRWEFAMAALRGLLRAPPRRFTIDLGDGSRRVRTRAIAIVANGYDEGFGQVMARSRLDGGHLVLYVARRFGLWWSVRVLAGMLLGAWRGQDLLDERATTGLTIDANRAALRVMNDGEGLLLTTPLRYRVRPRALRVLTPAAPAQPAPAHAVAAA